MRRRVTGNLLWMLAERGLQVGCGIAIVAMLARALGPVGFAHFQYAQSVVLVAGSLAFVCSAEVIVPRLVAAPSPTAEQELVLHALILRLLGAFSGYLLMYAFLGVTSASADVWQAALLLGVAFLLREPFGVAIAWMQAHINNRPGTLFSLLALAVKMALVVGLVLLGASSVADFASAIAIEAVVLAVLLSAYYVRKTPRQAIVWQLPLMRELVSTGSLFWVSFILMMAARRVDQLILQPAVPAPDFAAYAACIQILDNFTIVASILAAGIAPAYVYRSDSLATARKNVLRITTLLAILGMGGAVIIASLAPWIVHLLYGSRFSAAVSLLQGGAIISVLAFVDVGLTLMAVYMRRPAWIAMKWGIVLTGTVIVDLWLIPRYGVRGALIGYGAAYLLATMAGVATLIASRMHPLRVAT